MIAGFEKQVVQRFREGKNHQQEAGVSISDR